MRVAFKGSHLKLEEMNFRKMLILFLITLTASCDNSETNVVKNNCNSCITNEIYILTDSILTLQNRRGYDFFLVNKYTHGNPKTHLKYLKSKLAMINDELLLEHMLLNKYNEPVYVNDYTKKYNQVESYRFKISETNLNTTTGTTKIIRIENKNDSINVTYKTIIANKDTSILSESSSHELNLIQWRGVLSEVKKSNFWTLTNYRYFAKNESFKEHLPAHNDRSFFTLEGFIIDSILISEEKYIYKKIETQILEDKIEKLINLVDSLK